jgi:hypothetical protein
MTNTIHRAPGLVSLHSKGLRVGRARFDLWQGQDYISLFSAGQLLLYQIGTGGSFPGGRAAEV